MSRPRRHLAAALTATAVLVVPLSLAVPTGTATAATPDSFSIGAGAGVLPGGTGSVIPITYVCTSSLPYVTVLVTQAATHGRVAQAGGSFAPTCDGAKHAMDVVAGVQNTTPMHQGAAAIQVQSPMPGGLQKVVTLGSASFTTPGVVASARRYGGGAVITVNVPDAACPAGGTATGLATLTQRVGQQIQTG